MDGRNARKVEVGKLQNTLLQGAYKACNKTFFLLFGLLGRLTAGDKGLDQCGVQAADGRRGVTILQGGLRVGYGKQIGQEGKVGTSPTSQGLVPRLILAITNAGL